jgi:Ricin-type beta-trefoil lectin domain
MKFHRAWSIVLFSILCAVVAPNIVAAATYRMNVQSVPEAGGKCISVPNGQFVEGMRVFIWDCNAALAKTLVYDDQSQQLKFGANCVEVLGQGNARDAIGVGTCKGSVSQRWSMTPNKDNYQIIGVNSLCLDISNGVTTDGTPLELAPCAANNVAELWVLLQASDASAPQPAPVAAIAGSYRVRGTNPDKSKYTGTVVVSQVDGNRYRFDWSVANQTFTGTGVLNGNAISVDWGQDFPVIYQVGAAGVLNGTWSNGHATEVLTPSR